MNGQYPVPGFRFVVTLSNNSRGEANYDASFQEISGVSVEIPTEDVYEGGENRFAFRLPIPTKYPNLVLKRGYMAISSDFDDWINGTLDTGFAKPIELRNIVVTLLDEENFPLMTWTFEGAYPVKKEVSGFAAEKNQLLVEHMEFAYHRFEERLS